MLMIDLSVRWYKIAMDKNVIPMALVKMIQIPTTFKLWFASSLRVSLFSSDDDDGSTVNISKDFGSALPFWKLPNSTIKLSIVATPGKECRSLSDKKILVLVYYLTYPDVFQHTKIHGIVIVVIIIGTFLRTVEK